MKKWYCILQGRCTAPQTGIGHWAQIYKTFVYAEDKAQAIVEFHTTVDKENIPQGWRKKNLSDTSLLLQVYPIGEEHFTEAFTYERTCRICGKTYMLIDKFNEFGKYGNYECCSEECDAIRSKQRHENINDNMLGFFDSIPVIYKITQISTGKVYIGKTVRAFTLRWWEHIKATTATDKFHKVMATTELTDWTFQVLEVLPKKSATQDILDRERYWIKRCDAVTAGFNTVYKNT